MGSNLRCLAYYPAERRVETNEGMETIYPDILKGVPHRFAIDKRIRFMLDQSDYVICYVNCPTGGAAKYKTLAEKRDKKIVNPALLMKP